MASVYDWSRTAIDNDDADSGIDWAEGMAASAVNNSGRQMMARVAEFLDDLGATQTTGGSANAHTLTARSGFAAYTTGIVIAFKAGFTNTGATTFNVNGIGAKAIRKVIPTTGETALSAGDITAAGVYLVTYDEAANSAAGAWILLNPATLSSSGLTISLAGGGAAAISLSGEASTVIGARRFSDDAVGPVVNLVKGRGTIASPTSLSTSDRFGIVQFSAQDSGGAWTAGAGQLDMIATHASPSTTNNGAQFRVLLGDGAGALSIAMTVNLNSGIGLVSKTVAELGSITATAARFLYCTDESGGPIPVFGDGTNWRRVSDRAIVS